MGREGGAVDRKFLIAWAVVFVAWMAGSFVVHGAMLGGAYAELPALYRTETETQSYMYLMLIAHIIMAGAFVWIYQRGAEAKPWLMQGVRYGIAIALLAPVPMYTIYYVVQPLPPQLVVGQIIGDSLLVIVLGMLVAFLYRDASTA